MDQHIRILSVLFVILGILGLLAALAFFALGAGTSATILSQDHSNDARVGAAWAGGCMSVIAALIGILSIPAIVTGWGLSKRKAWSRILTMVVAVFHLPSFPFGTALGVYALVIMLNDETKTILVN